jgi:sulfite reductase (NADPH) flavoprotein alpha-component
VAAFLASTSLDGAQPVGPDSNGARATLAEALARSHLPAAEAVAGLDARAVAQALQPLPHREYSIASLPAEGTIDLLVRQMARPDGSPGLGSGWLCAHAAPGDGIAVRIRANPNFHAPDPARPLILVGNGTGIAGLRAHLKARVAAGARRNWLLFGERNADRDWFHRDEILAWQAEGYIERLDLAFSRDGGPARYVQDALRANAAALEDWIDDGAAILVCGSLQGMAPGVDAVLRDVLGAAQLETLRDDGRYRRDVY